MRSFLSAGVLVIALAVAGLMTATDGAIDTAAAASAPQHHSAAAVIDSSNIAKQYAFRAAMRELWEDHVVWTRQVIVAIIAGTPDTDAALARLLRNQEDIGDAIKPFYGDAAGDRLTVLLREHILIAGALLTAAKSGDPETFAAARTQWYRNGDDIARFLASANPHWPLADMQAAMTGHLDTTLAEAVARLTGDWTGDVVAYDAVHRHILHMADTLSEGIIAQFPAAFARSQ
ncbi:MAG TPA: hypothetical protein VJP45_07670 [Candidatus Limnocylindria bacterium]|nr:hypothetical protein [Candidatus Limnocylindria bacterium]